MLRGAETLQEPGPALPGSVGAYIDAYLPEQRAESVLGVDPNEPDIDAWFIDLDSTITTYDGFRAPRDIRDHCERAREGPNPKTIVAFTNAGVETVDDVIRLYSLAVDTGAQLVLFAHEPAMRKPSPYMPLQGMQYLGLTPDQVRAIGDKDSDCLSAHLAGIEHTTQVERYSVGDHPGDRWVRRNVIRALKLLGNRALPVPERRQHENNLQPVNANTAYPWQSLDIPDYILKDPTIKIPGINCDLIRLDQDTLSTIPPPPLSSLRAAIAKLYPHRLAARMESYANVHGVKTANALTNIRPRLGVAAGACIVAESFVDKSRHPKLKTALKVAGVVLTAAGHATDMDGWFARRQLVENPATGAMEPVDMKSPERLEMAAKDPKADKQMSAAIAIAHLIAGNRHPLLVAAQLGSMVHSDKIHRPKWQRWGYETPTTTSGKVTTLVGDVIDVAAGIVAKGSPSLLVADTLSTVSKVYSRLINLPIAWRRRHSKKQIARIIDNKFRQASATASDA